MSEMDTGVTEGWGMGMETTGHKRKGTEERGKEERGIGERGMETTGQKEKGMDMLNPGIPNFQERWVFTTEYRTYRM